MGKAEPEQDSATAQEDAPADAPATEGEVLGESDEATEAPGAEESAAPAPESEELFAPAASSTLEVGDEATSTPPVEEPKPVEEPLVLQPGVALSISGNTVSAVITLQNLTCTDCGKELPEVEVLTYYTPWYPNDGPLADYAEASVKTASQARSVADLPVEATRELTWSAEVPSGHYYVVVEVDPENANDAYRLFRSEFAI